MSPFASPLPIDDELAPHGRDAFRCPSFYLNIGAMPGSAFAIARR